MIQIIVEVGNSKVFLPNTTLHARIIKEIIKSHEGLEHQPISLLNQFGACGSLRRSMFCLRIWTPTAIKGQCLFWREMGRDSQVRTASFERQLGNGLSLLLDRVVESLVSNKHKNLVVFQLLKELMAKHRWRHCRIIYQDHLLFMNPQPTVSFQIMII